MMLYGVLTAQPNGKAGQKELAVALHHYITLSLTGLALAILEILVKIEIKCKNTAIRKYHAVEVVLELFPPQIFGPNKSCGSYHVKSNTILTFCKYDVI